MQASHWTKVLYTRWSQIGINCRDIEPALRKENPVPRVKDKNKLRSHSWIGILFSGKGKNL